MRTALKSAVQSLASQPLLEAPVRFLGQGLNKLQTRRTASRGYPIQDEWLRSARGLHQGERCFIIATGPSLNDLDLRKLKGETCFGVNGTYLLEDIDLTYFVYVSTWWHNHHIDGIRGVRCRRRFLPDGLQHELAAAIPTTYYRRILPRYEWCGIPLPVPAGFSKEPFRYMYAGGTVIFICLQLALYMGFDQVILIGLDHSYSATEDRRLRKRKGDYLIARPGTQTHFSAKYSKDGTNVHIDLNAMEHGYVVAKNAFEAEGKVILNASSKSNLEVYQRIRFDSLFRS